MEEWYKQYHSLLRFLLFSFMAYNRNMWPNYVLKFASPKITEPTCFTDDFNVRKVVFSFCIITMTGNIIRA